MSKISAGGDHEGRLKRTWHAEVLSTILDRQATKNVYRNAEVMPGWHDCSAIPNLSVSSAGCHTSICCSLSLFLPGSVLHSLRSRLSPTFVTSLAPVSPSLIIPSLLILSHNSSVLPVLKNHTLYFLHLTLSLSHHPSSRLHALSYPHTHSVFIF